MIDVWSFGHEHLIGMICNGSACPFCEGETFDCHGNSVAPIPMRILAKATKEQFLDAAVADGLDPDDPGLHDPDCTYYYVVSYD